MRNYLVSMIFAALIAFVAHADGVRVLNDDVHFPEGPVWYHGKLYYVEYDRNSVTRIVRKLNLVRRSTSDCGRSWPNYMSRLTKRRAEP